ncbi:MAG: hypothetical protein ACIWVG_24520 [Gloeotrichia echinulata HAB0833]
MTYLSELNGKKLAVMDSLIAATAHHHKLTLVTRNVDDFKLTPVKIIAFLALVRYIGKGTAVPCPYIA